MKALNRSKGVKQKWNNIISDQECSGKTVLQYCREHDVTDIKSPQDSPSPEVIEKPGMTLKERGSNNMPLHKAPLINV